MNARLLAPDQRARLLAVALFVVACLVLVVAGCMYYRGEEEEIARDKYQALAAIGELKASQIEQWRKEHLAEVGRAAKDSNLVKAIGNFLGAPDNQAFQSGLRESLELDLGDESPANVLLFDPGANLLFAVNDSHRLVPEPTREVIRAALSGKESVLSGFYRSGKGAVHIDAAAAVRDEGGRPLAVLVQRNHARDNLFSLLQFWPAASRSTETILVQKEGEEVVFVNKLRNVANAPMDRRYPMTRTSLPGVQSALGTRGRFEGKDYRGVDVLADLRPIPGSPWFMVSKVDRNEILADARYRAGIFSLILGLIMLLSAATVALFYRQRHRGIARDLIRAERLRVESEETFHLLFEHMSEGCAYCQMLFEDGRANDWIYLTVNETFEKLTGLKDVAGKLVSEVIPGIRENDPELFEFYARVTRTGKPEKIEIFVHALQQWYSVSVYSPQKDYFVAVFDIITERKRAEEAMLRSRNMLAHILNSVPQAVFWKDRNSVYLGCNMVYARVAGLASPEEIVGKTDFDFGWARQDAEGYIADDREVMEGNRAKFHIEETVRDESGARLWYDTSKLPLTDSSGRVYGVLGVYEDITERRLAEEELQNLRTAVEQSANTVVVTDSNGRIEYVNPAFEKSTGYTAAEAIGNNPRVLKSGEQDTAFYHNLWTTITSGKIWRGEFHNRRKDGSLYWESATISPVHNDQGRVVHFIAVKEDITERKVLESSLIEALNLAEAGNRAKSEFLAIMSHELRTPLNGVLGFAELLAGSPLDEDQKESVRTIRNSGTHLLQIVSDILDFSSIEKGSIKFEAAPVLVADLVESSCLPNRKTAADKGLEFRCEVDPRVPEQITGDSRRICQILINLIANAVKFTERGSVVLRVAPAPHGDRPRLDFSVQDTGIGIPPETIRRLFKPFTQADSKMSRRFEGTGLGLAISQRLAEGMGGKITVDSTSGQGSTFTFRIPVDAAASSNNETDTTFRPDKHGGKTTPPFSGDPVLVVEDDPDNASLAMKMIATLGYRAEHAANGQEALDAFGSRTFSVILMDMQMPVMDGLSATKKIREIEVSSGVRVPVIALTANVLPVHKEICVAAGMDDYLSKPFTKAQLAEKLARFARKSFRS